jgi:tetratricopeptide (TPR) repeat protein
MKMGAILLFLSAALCAQLNLAEVQGDVIDMLGQPIAGAQVVYTNVANGKTYQMQTDRNGKFHMVGLIPGDYQVEITEPSGRRIYSGRRPASAGDKQALNVIHIDLSLVPTKASLVPFKGPTAAQIQGAAWRNVTEENLRDLTPEQMGELRAENAAIVHYNELTPQAQAAIKAQDWPQALELLQRLITIAPYQWQLFQNLGAIQRNLQQNEDAVQSFERGIRALAYDDSLKKDRQKPNVDSIRAQMMIAEGEAYGALDQLDAAAGQYREAAQIDPKPALAYMHLCTVEYNIGNSDAALEACASGIAADPRQPEFYQILAGIESNLEKYEDAISVYEKGIRLTLRKMESAKTSMSSKNDSPGATAYSITTLTRALAEQMLPAEGSTYYKSRIGQMLLSEGNAYFQLRKYKQAAELFARAAGMHNYPSLALFNLCATRFDMDDLKAAIEACDKAIASDPQMADAYFVRACALYGDSARRGKHKTPQGAIAALQKYLELSPDGSYSDDARAMLRELGRTN